MRVCAGSVLSSLHSSVLAQGYVKRRTCCCGSRQIPLEGCTSVSQQHDTRAPPDLAHLQHFGRRGDPKMNPSGRDVSMWFDVAK